MSIHHYRKSPSDVLVLVVCSEAVEADMEKIVRLSSQPPSLLPRKLQSTSRSAKRLCSITQVHHRTVSTKPATFGRHLHPQHTLTTLTHQTTSRDLFIQHTHLHRHQSLTIVVNDSLLVDCMMQITPITGLHAKSNALLCLVVGPPRRQDTALALNEIEELLEGWLAVFLAGLNGAVVDFALEGILISATKTEGIDEEFKDVFFAAVV
jgi:hypothetical protein